MNDVAIRDAATLILMRRQNDGPARILMGQRGAKAAFMPNKFVFPGGALDDGALDIPLAHPINDICGQRLSEAPNPERAAALPAAAIRELWEETGLMLGQPGQWDRAAPDDWRDFSAQNLCPSAAGLTYVFRAITPPGRPRRFDARFFLADASDVAGDLDDFSAASDELSHLQWIALSEARQLDLPFITEVVLAEVAAMADHTAPPASVPFFNNTDEESLFERIYGAGAKPPE